MIALAAFLVLASMTLIQEVRGGQTYNDLGETCMHEDSTWHRTWYGDLAQGESFTVPSLP